MKNLKLKTVDDIIYFAGDGRENLLIKVRGRGWFISSGENDQPGLTSARMKAWLRDDAEDFKRVKVEHFYIESPKTNKRSKKFLK